MVGDFAVSKAGHDKGTRYIILIEEESNVYVVDGLHRPVEKPKKKSKKHLQGIVKYVDLQIKERIQSGDIPRNEEIRKAIKNYEIHVRKQEK